MAPLTVGARYVFDRDEIESSGALSLAELLERIPGVTTFRTGWMASPQVASYGGDFGRVRIFYDGVEWDDLNPRDGATFDLRSIPLWTLRQVTVERGATGLRVDLRSWEYERTAPYTRVDALTGDFNTNLYRAYFAKRFYNGAGLQVAAQQYGTTNLREGGGGDETGVFLRYGVSRRLWSVDAAGVRLFDNRSTTSRFFGAGGSLPPFRGSSTVAYLRGAIGEVGAGPFLQIIASSEVFRETSARLAPSQAAALGVPADTADSLASMAQYVATAGLDRGGLQLRLVERYRRRAARGYSSPAASLTLDRGVVGIAARAERDGYLGVTLLEAGARLTPLPFISVAATLGDVRPAGAPAAVWRPREAASRSARLEAGVRLGGALWLAGGVLARDTTVTGAASLFDTAFVSRATGRRVALFGALRGPVIYGVSTDVVALRWREPGPYTPAYQVRAEARYFTRLLSRFPAGNFSFLLAPRVEYRASVAFPTASGDLIAPGSRIVSLRTELRILRAVLSFERRNVAGTIYEQVPGFVLPRGANVYGVRWYFFN